MPTRRTAIAAVASSIALAGCLFEDAIDERGDLEIVIDGEPVDLTEDRFQAEHADDYSIDFHLHEGHDGWFMEGEERVTAGEAIDLLPHFELDVDGGDPIVRFDGETYDAGDDGTAIEFAVDGEPIDPTAYELRDGDELRLAIESDESA
ncbi:hypothetical protein [Halovivax gelatinilyticus]|uniref:hypothetical protein n=1 Tax=Halovivax gelatinilyticus TaxID=2961597 RepID=UPI0020CA31FB|nr:hypothetical protein [Halovivax gelatinilyticus]